MTTLLITGRPTVPNTRPGISGWVTGMMATTKAVPGGQQAGTHIVLLPRQHPRPHSQLGPRPWEAQLATVSRAAWAAFLTSGL